MLTYILSRTVSKLSQIIVQILEKRHFAFLSSFMRVSWATYAVHLRLIIKHVVDFLLLIIELFSLLRLRCDEQKSAFSKVVDQPNFCVEGDVPHHSFLH